MRVIIRPRGRCDDATQERELSSLIKGLVGRRRNESKEEGTNDRRRRRMRKRKERMRKRKERMMQKRTNSRVCNALRCRRRRLRRRGAVPKAARILSWRTRRGKIIIRTRNRTITTRRNKGRSATGDLLRDATLAPIKLVLADWQLWGRSRVARVTEAGRWCAKCRFR